MKNFTLTFYMGLEEVCKKQLQLFWIHLWNMNQLNHQRVIYCQAKYFMSLILNSLNNGNRYSLN